MLLGMPGLSWSVLKVTQESLVACIIKQLKWGYTISAGYCQIAEHSLILKVNDLLPHITYYLQWWSQFSLHSSHSSSPLHLPSCNELKRHTLCRVWALEHWMKFLVKLYLQVEPVNGRMISEVLIKNCKADYSVLLQLPSIQEGSPPHTHTIQTT